MPPPPQHVPGVPAVLARGTTPSSAHSPNIPGDTPWRADGRTPAAGLEPQQHTFLSKELLNAGNSHLQLQSQPAMTDAGLGHSIGLLCCAPRVLSSINMRAGRGSGPDTLLLSFLVCFDAHAF